MRLARPLLFLLLCTACAPETPRDPMGIAYLPATSLPPELLPAPKRPGQPGFEEELAAVRAAQRAMTASDFDALTHEEHVHLTLMTDGLSRPVSRETHPQLFAWLDRVSATSRGVVDQDKAYFLTKRPNLVSPDIEPRVHALNNGAYPSGHATFAYLMANVLGEAFPGDRPALLERARLIGLHREMAGVHYPQDIKAGERLAGIIVARLHDTAAYRADRDAAIAELR